MEREAVNIKGTLQGLVITLEPGIDFEQTKNLLNTKIQSAKGFFQGARFGLDIAQNTLSKEQVNELKQICCRYGLVPVEQSSDLKIDRQQKKTAPATKTVSPDITEQTLFINHSLRSGQHIDCVGNVVIHGNVNSGSEIRATGDIVVFGQIRGYAHAGFTGDTKAKIVAFGFNCPVIRIARHMLYLAELAPVMMNKPVCAKVKDGRIHIEEL